MICVFVLHVVRLLPYLGCIPWQPPYPTQPQPTTLLQVLEHKLRALERFLSEAAKRRKACGFGKAAGSAGGPPSAQGGGGLFVGYLEDGTNRLLNAGNAAAGGMMAGDAPFAKRQRMWNAFVMEEQRNDAVR